MIFTGSRVPCAYMPGDDSLYATYMPFYLVLSGRDESSTPFFTASVNFLALLLFSASQHLPVPHILLWQRTALSLFLTRNTHCRSAAEVTFMLVSQVKQDHLHFSEGHFFSLGGIWPFSCSEKSNHPRCSPPFLLLSGFLYSFPSLMPNTQT